jgi:hypothetical protein
MTTTLKIRRKQNPGESTWILRDTRQKQNEKIQEEKGNAILIFTQYYQRPIRQ